MASAQTPNYGLSQWIPSDKIRMEDFNADNQKLDQLLNTIIHSLVTVGPTAPTETYGLWVDTTPNTGGLKHWDGSKWAHTPVAYT